MHKFGSCKFTVNDLVLYTSRNGVLSDASYQVIDVLPNKDGSFEDRPFIENYWIRDIETKKEYRVYHSELRLKQ
jgi:hypothetical protein